MTKKLTPERKIEIAERQERKREKLIERSEYMINKFGNITPNTNRDRAPLTVRNTRGGPTSRRAMEGRLKVIDIKCPKCNHRKGLRSDASEHEKCAKCGYELRPYQQAVSNMKEGIKV